MMTIYAVQIQRDGQWRRWGVYMYLALAERVRLRRAQEGRTARVVSLTVDEPPERRPTRRPTRKEAGR